MGVVFIYNPQPGFGLLHPVPPIIPLVIKFRKNSIHKNSKILEFSLKPYFVFQDYIRTRGSRVHNSALLRGRIFRLCSFEHRVHFFLASNCRFNYKFHCFIRRSLYCS